MFYACGLRVFRNFSFVHLISKHSPKNLANQCKVLFSTTRFPIDTISKLDKDILLFSFERSRFYKYMSIFGIAQFAAWSFYGGMMYMSMKDLSNEDFQKYQFFTKSPIWKQAASGNNNFLLAIVFCIILGVLSAVVCTILPSRIVKGLTLCKGGKTVILETYGPFGKAMKREVPLENLNCVTSRSETKAYLSIKVKPKWFYYLIDIRGNFHNPKLFDYTIGTRASKAY